MLPYARPQQVQKTNFRNRGHPTPAVRLLSGSQVHNSYLNNSGLLGLKYVIP